MKSKKDFIRLKLIELFKLKSFEYDHYKSVLNGKVDGNYNSKLKLSQVYWFNLDEYGQGLYSSFVLFHELRHHYQNKYNRLGRHDIEKDCHRFAWKMFDRHYETIKKILED